MTHIPLSLLESTRIQIPLNPRVVMTYYVWYCAPDRHSTTKEFTPRQDAEEYLAAGAPEVIARVEHREDHTYRRQKPFH